MDENDKGFFVVGIRKWGSSRKFAIVLEGMKEKTTVVDLCIRHGISQTQYYKWRDQFLSNGSKVFDPALGIEQIFTSCSSPKGSADTERFVRALKEDLVYPYEYEGIATFRESLGRWVKSYNEDYPHSALKLLTPREFNQKHQTNSKPSVA